VTRLFDKYSKVCKGDLLNSAVTPYIVASEMQNNSIAFENYREF